MRSNFETDNNDLDYILIKYTEYCLLELNKYGSSKTGEMLLILSLGQQLNKIEKNIFDNYYNNYVELVLNDITDTNIYYLQKILFTITNLIIKMIIFYIFSIKKTEETKYKLRYIIGSLENYIEKVIIPIETELKNILYNNTIFKLDYSIKYLREFIEKNKNKFSSIEKINKLNNLLNFFDDI
jgi:hypothetical protein